mgnify:FL=1
MNIERKKLILIAAGVTVLAVVGMALIYFVPFRDAAIEKAVDTRPTPRNAYEVAFPVAQVWRADAQLAFLQSLDAVGETGRGNAWRFIFTSPHPSMNNQGYVIEVRNQAVTTTHGMQYRGFGAEFPAFLLAQDIAIARVHQIKGYEREQITGIEAVYGPKEKTWYWGVRTPKGVVSVEAR